MIVTPIDLGIDMLATDLVRSPGLHASTIFNDLFKFLDPKRYDYGDEEANPLLLAVGTAWEKHLEYLLLKNGIKAERPDEFMSPEGIAYSPDLILFNGITRLGEIKWTSKSAKHMPTEITNSLPPSLDKYLCQVKLYSHWLGLKDAWLCILFMHQPWNPDLRVFDLQFTDRELEENYRMVMNHAVHSGMLK